MRTAIIVRTDNTIEGYTGFKKMCNLLGLPYNYLKRLPYPINYKGMIIDKVELKQRLTFCNLYKWRELNLNITNKKNVN